MNSTIPADLLELKSRFENWRTNRKYVREPIPDELWNAAADLSRHYPPSLVGRVLKHGEHSARQYSFWDVKLARRRDTLNFEPFLNNHFHCSGQPRLAAFTLLENKHMKHIRTIVLGLCLLTILGPEIETRTSFLKGKTSFSSLSLKRQSLICKTLASPIDFLHRGGFPRCT